MQLQNNVCFSLCFYMRENFAADFFCSSMLRKNKDIYESFCYIIVFFNYSWIAIFAVMYFVISSTKRLVEGINELKVEAVN